MSAPSAKPTTVSLADEEGVRCIVVDTLFGLWATVDLIREHHARWVGAQGQGTA